ncbi:MAG: hypothetical protein U0324_04890 [Polyangiales bacterium]
MTTTPRHFSILAAFAPCLCALAGVSACSGSRAPDAATPAVTTPTGGERVPDAATSADVAVAADGDGWAGAPLLDRARARVGASVAVAWPGAGGFDDVIAYAGVSRRPGSRPQDRVVSWYREGGASPAPTDNEYPVGPFAPTALAALDVNADGRADLLAFGDGAPVQDGVTGTVLAFELPPDRDQPLPLTALSAALDGAHDPDQVRARLPVTRGLAVDDIGTSTALSLLGRLSFSSPAQLRAAMASGGVEVCDLTASGGRVTARRCRRLTERTADAVLLRDVRAEIENAFTNSVLTFTCGAGAGGDVCTVQHAAGGQRQEFAFAGAGAARRLARVHSTDFPDAGE